MCGYYSLLLQGNGECELNNIAVLPEYRHKGIGRQLLAQSFNIAKELGCRIINIAIVEENRVLRKWYDGHECPDTGQGSRYFYLWQVPRFLNPGRAHA